MDDYAYINARVRAREGRLFDRTRYNMLFTLGVTQELVARLLESPYAEALAQVGKPSTTDDQRDASTRLESALRRDLRSCLTKIKEMTTGRPRTLIDAVLLRWDADNLKTVLRGQWAQAPIDAVLGATFPVGHLDEVALAELARTRTAREVADTLRTWRSPFARPLSHESSAIGQADILQPIELALDRFVFTEGFQAVKDGDDDDGTVKEYLRYLLDRTNLLTAVRYVAERTALSPIEASRSFIDAGGRFSRRHFQMVLSAQDLRQGLARLADTPFAWLMDRFRENASPSPTRIQQVLDRAVVRHAGHLARRDPLGIGVVIAYIEEKAGEVRNLRTIMRGKAAAMAAEQIEEWLTI